MEDINILIQTMIECAKAIRRQLGPGYLESVYKNAMLIEIEKHHLPYQTEVPLNVFYDGIVVGKYRADIIVGKRLILEIKATTNLTVANEIQPVNYLTATGIDDGLLVNFGADLLQFKRKYRVYRQSK